HLGIAQRAGLHPSLVEDANAIENVRRERSANRRLDLIDSTSNHQAVLCVVRELVVRGLHQLHGVAIWQDVRLPQSDYTVTVRLVRSNHVSVISDDQLGSRQTMCFCKIVEQMLDLRLPVCNEATVICRYLSVNVASSVIVI